MANSFKEMRDRAASAALAGAAVDPLTKGGEDALEIPTEELPIEEPMGEEPMGDEATWVSQGFSFELIEGPEGQQVIMTPVDGSGESVTITDPEKVAFLLSQRNAEQEPMEEMPMEEMPMESEVMDAP